MTSQLLFISVAVHGLDGDLFVNLYRRGSTSFAHADLAREAAEAARDEIRRLPEVGLVELTAQFTTTESDPSTEAVLVKALVHPRGDGAASALASKVREAIERRVQALDPRLRTFVRVDVLPRPATQ